MLELLDHPAVQGGVAPLVSSLIVAALLARTRFAWLAIIAGYATMVVLAGDFSFSPLTAARKVMLIGVVAALVGLAADLVPQPPRYLASTLVVVGGLVASWAFISVLRQREGMAGYATGGGIVLFVALLVAAVLRLRADGVRTGAAGLGLGLATGIAAVLSASIGYLLAGVAIAAASGALLLMQVILARELAAGFTGALPIGLLAALFAVATLLLAQLPWYALPLLLLVPLAAALPVPQRAPMMARAAMASGYALAAALLPILAAWYAARGSLT